MRIAILADDALPGSTLVHAKMLHELALELIARGHQPVIIAPGSARQSSRLQVDTVEGVSVYRFRSGPTRGGGMVRRALNESLLSFKAWLAIRTAVKEDPVDAIVCYSPTIFFGPLVRWLKSLNTCRSYLVLRDLFPQWVVDEGLIKSGSLIEGYFRFFERLNYKAANSIGLMSPKNLEFFDSQQNELYRTHVLYNWACTTPFEGEVGVDVRREYDLGDKVIFFYGGNIGHAQDMHNLLRLARSMRVRESVHFLFVGQGDEVGMVKEFIAAEGLVNITLLPSVSQDVFKGILGQVDVGLFSLARSHKAHNFPGKLLGYMVESLPMLGGVNPGNDLIDVVEGADAGRIFVNGEDEKLLLAATAMADDPALCKRLGNNARQLLLDTFSVESAAETILSQLQQGDFEVSL